MRQKDSCEFQSLVSLTHEIYLSENKTMNWRRVSSTQFLLSLITTNHREGVVTESRLTYRLSSSARKSKCEELGHYVVFTRIELLT